ncbi:hypothetical protein PR048_019741 [Dryococelus australis]|uniref:Uncharacterized protein n=1 Tax=Dryococelus australis TaxID=614101 RepID=A0ABQ9H4B0_9NEOP|nr:hypothetical protein PR048_019741 [Dryococelus australis]
MVLLNDSEHAFLLKEYEGEVPKRQWLHVTLFTSTRVENNGCNILIESDCKSSTTIEIEILAKPLIPGADFMNQFKIVLNFGAPDSSPTPIVSDAWHVTDKFVGLLKKDLDLFHMSCQTKIIL